MNIKIKISIVFILLSLVLGGFIGYKKYQEYKIKQKAESELKAYEDAKANFKVEVELIDKNTISFGEDVNLKEYVASSNVDIEDKVVLFEEFGEKEVELDYKDPYGRTGSYSFKLEVVDDVKPVLLSPSTYTILRGRYSDLLDGVVCADYVSSNVKCEVEGDYNLDVSGSYKLNYKATDEKGNYTTEEFILNVVDNKEGSEYNPTYYNFKDIYDTYKTDKTMIGLDVSEWQGYIDFDRVRDAGAEFVIIRLGTFYNGRHHLDERYEQNIKNAKNAGLKVGLYYYSEAITLEEAISCAEFVNDHISYEIDLPIAYDWEDWNYYNSYKLSIYDFDKMSYAFMDKIEEFGYEAMLYGSVNYLENMWKPKNYRIWTAQYYKENQYNGKSYMWQRTSTGMIDGIEGAVDIDILYLD